MNQITKVAMLREAAEYTPGFWILKTHYPFEHTQINLIQSRYKKLSFLITIKQEKYLIKNSL